MNRVDELAARARRWLEIDPDPATRRQIETALERRDLVELEQMFGTVLRFGTAGLRGAVGPGPNRMNRAVARRTAGGLASHLRSGTPSSASEHAARRSVVLGHDARHGSAEFAREITDELTLHGIDVTCFDEAVPTPLVAFAVLDGHHDAGVVVTASHNPAADNGIKVFGADGAQIAPPDDAAIAALIDAPLVPDASERGRIRALGPGAPVVARYVEHTASVTGSSRQLDGLRVAYTALHGVGAELLESVLARIGVTDIRPVASQRAPDPDFPTAPRPNPEEPGVLDELLELADASGSDLAVALDPDADRVAVAVPVPGTGSERWRVLTGDELGVLFALHLIDATEPGATEPGATRPDVSERRSERLVVSTIVSSRLVQRVCARHGVRHAETLSGFKWLCRPGLAHPELQQLLMYEEALGYGIGLDARDKDGIRAAALACAMVATRRQEGRSVLDVLDDLARTYGVFVTRNGSIPTEPGAFDVAALELFDASPGSDPPHLGGAAVIEVDRPAPEVLRAHLGDDTRVIIRPSGTEPKLKYYCEVIEPLGGRSPATARRSAEARATRVVDDLAVRLGLPASPV